jgi:hypothetical protein
VFLVGSPPQNLEFQLSYSPIPFTAASVDPDRAWVYLSLLRVLRSPSQPPKKAPSSSIQHSAHTETALLRSWVRVSGWLLPPPLPLSLSPPRPRPPEKKRLSSWLLSWPWKLGWSMGSLISLFPHLRVACRVDYEKEVTLPCGGTSCRETGHRSLQKPSLLPGHLFLHLLDERPLLAHLCGVRLHSHSG